MVDAIKSGVAFVKTTPRSLPSEHGLEFGGHYTAGLTHIGVSRKSGPPKLLVCL